VQYVLVDDRLIYHTDQPAVRSAGYEVTDRTAHTDSTGRTTGVGIFVIVNADVERRRGG